jgi:uncharacterized membrane protein YeaQ/YmgE (transglycosylase-associated protein family)
MEVTMFSLIGFLIFGLIVGACARALVPGKDSLSWPQTALLGCAGSFAGGLIGKLLGRGTGLTVGFIGSVIGGVIVLILYKKYGKGAGQGKR